MPQPQPEPQSWIDGVPSPDTKHGVDALFPPLGE
jgi:hypothetical protein